MSVNNETDNDNCSENNESCLELNNSISELDILLGKNGIILLEDECSYNSSLNCKKMLLNLAHNPNVDKITIFINSCGGEFDSFIGLHDIILLLRKKFKKEITTVVSGIAASGAAVVLQAGSPRLATKNSVIMVHEVSSNFKESKTSDIVAKLDVMKKFQKITFKIWADNMKISVQELQKLIGKDDLFISAKEGKTYGLIDDII